MQVQNLKFNNYLHLTFTNLSIIIYNKFNKHTLEFLYILLKEGNIYNVRKSFVSSDNLDKSA